MIEPHAILKPICGMALVTFAVACILFYVRIGEMRRKRVHPQKMDVGDQGEMLLPEQMRASDNFENLFEMPVLFYVACLTIFVSGLTDMTYVVMAWIYVLARAHHSFIHCTYNKVLHRFYVYFFSCILLGTIWARIAGQMIFSGRF